MVLKPKNISTPSNLKTRTFVYFSREMEEVKYVYDREESSDILVTSDVFDFGRKTKTINKDFYSKVVLYQADGGDKEYVIKFQDLMVENDLSEEVIREIAILRRLEHPNIIPLDGIVSGERVGFVMPKRNQDLKQLLQSVADVHKVDRETQLKRVYDLILGVAYLHSRDVIHRDLKPENLLYNQEENRIEIADFGLARSLGCVKDTGMTEDMVTLWYRPPEILLGTRNYSYPVDVWAVGAIIYEIMTTKVLFQEYSNRGMLNRIFRTTGTPVGQPDTNYPFWFGVEDLPGYQGYFLRQKPDENQIQIPPFTHLLERSLVLDPQKRASIFELLEDPIFDSVRSVSDEPVRFTCLDNLYLRRLMPIINPFSQTLNLDDRERRNLSDWLIGVNQYFKLTHQTYFLTITWLNRFIPHALPADEFQVWGITLLYVANVFHEVKPFSIRDVVNAPFIDIQEEQIMKYVRKFFRMIQYDLITSTPLDFMKEYIRIAYPDKIKNLALVNLYFQNLGENPFLLEPYQQALWAIYQACLYYDVAYVHEQLLSAEEIREHPAPEITDGVKKLFKKYGWKIVM